MLTWAVAWWYSKSVQYKLDEQPTGMLMFIAILSDVDLTTNLIKALL